MARRATRPGVCVCACAVDPIIRGYALRAFVEGESAEARYAAVAGWLNSCGEP